jgi:hypothetical protein
LPVIGAWLIAYRRYLSVRPDADMNYLKWCAHLGVELVRYGTLVTVSLGVAWMMTLPEKAASFATTPWPVLSFIIMSVPLLLTLIMKNEFKAWGYIPLTLALATGIVIAASREALRHAVLNGVHQYDFMDYKINMDWYSTVLFFATFALIGGTTLSYLITVAWRAGQTKGVYTPGPVVRRMGTIAIALLVGWIIQYFVVGFIVWAR